MWTFTLDVPRYPIEYYDIDREIELWELEYCIGEWFYTSYQWRKYERRLSKLKAELQVSLSDDRIELQYK